MTKEEIIEALQDDEMMPFIQPEHLAQIVDFVIKNYHPSLPSNLDEAAKESAERWRKNPDGSESRELFFQPHIRGFKAGAEWQRERMMENAVECDVYGHCSGWLTFGYVPECDFDFKPGDKVKLIIIKEEE